MAFDVRYWFVEASLLYGTDGPNTLKASGYATVMAGLGGDDTLRADAAGSVFDLGYWGGRGNDTLIGSYARDAYLYMPGDGHDTIRDDVRVFSQGPADYFYSHSNDLAYHDYLLFGPGLSPADVTPVREGNDLVFRVRGGEGSVRVADWFGSSVFTQIEYVSFMNGTVWTSGDLMRQFAPTHAGVQLSMPGDLQGSPYADSLIAGSYGAVLWGGAGNDDLGWKIDPGVFAVQYHGGTGDDLIMGSYGGDTYYFDRGDGKDTIVDDVRNLNNEGVNDFFLANSSFPSYQDTLVFGAGIAPGEVVPVRHGDDLVLQVGTGGNDSVTVRNFFDGTIFAQIESFRFADGSVRTMADMVAQVAPSYAGVSVRGSGAVGGTALADTLTATAWGTELYGFAGDDTLGALVNGAIFNVTFEGGRGNDVMTGTYGGDTYRYAIGDGSDTIIDSVRMYPTPGVAEYFLAHPDDPGYQDRLLLDMAHTELRDSRRVGADLVLEFRTEGDRITIKDWYDGTGLSRIELIGFSDGAMLAVHT